MRVQSIFSAFTLALLNVACSGAGSGANGSAPALPSFVSNVAAPAGAPNGPCAVSVGIVAVNAGSNCPQGGSASGSSAPGGAAPLAAGMQFVVYWEGAGSLSNMPQGVTCIDLAFGTISGSQVHFDPGAFGGQAGLTSGISAMHAKKIAVVLSLGGAGNPFSFTGNIGTFTSSLQSVVQQYAFDGVDFDDEQDQDAGTRAKVNNQLIPAARQMFTQMGKSNALITLAAYGGNPSDFGDGQILQSSGSSLSWINLMAYAPDLGAVQGMTTPYDGLIPLHKIVVGGIDNGGDMGGAPSVSMGQQLATWVKSKGYGGVMMWTIDQGQQYVQPIATILGT